MNANALLNDLRQAGVALHIEDDQLRYRSPRGVMTPALRATIQEHKGELLQLLAESTSPACPRCGRPGERQGLAVDDSGRGRYWCPGCGRLWWAKPFVAEDTRPSLWWEQYEEMTDGLYQSIVDHDIARHGYYCPTRSYAEPAKDPRSIWKWRGLPGIPVESNTDATSLAWRVSR